MCEVDVRADGEHRYVATITTAAGRNSEHVITADADLLAAREITSAEEPFLIRQVVQLLAQAADAAEAEGAPAAVPQLIDLRELDAARPELLASLPLGSISGC